MRSLANLQGDFQAYLLRGSEALMPQLIGTARVPVETRLEIYAGAYRSRLAEALAANYPALAQLLDADFDTLAHEYVRTHDSSFFSIRYYGDDLARFLSAHEDYARAPVLAELARWEWAMTHVFDAADAQPLTHAQLARVPPEQWAQLRFQWHPSVQRLALNWNVPQIWRALSDGAERPPTAFSHTPTQWLLWRQELTSYFRSLPPTEAAVLDAARSGWPCGELCALLCDELGDAQAPVQAATLLRGWVDSGLISGAA
jgi:hypothetical protein